ncbi:MAG: hypothetical protein ACTSQZ_01990 [Candidatus Thorarchaeota archaeon]
MSDKNFSRKVMLPEKKTCPKSYGYSDDGVHKVLYPRDTAIITDEERFDKMMAAGLVEVAPKKPKKAKKASSK